MPTDELPSAGWLKPFAEIRRAVADDDEWRVHIGPNATTVAPPCGIHLAVCVEPFLGYVLDGTKTVESRFSSTRCAPFGKVGKGDVVLLKRSGGGVEGIARVVFVWTYRLDASSWGEIRERFSESLRAQDPEFWEKRKGASYATLMKIDRVRAFKPVLWKKRDRRGWVVIKEANESLLFRGGDE